MSETEATMLRYLYDREQRREHAWADYALGNPDRARERNYRLRTGRPI